jgi:hypothetical protein
MYSEASDQAKGTCLNSLLLGHLINAVKRTNIRITEYPTFLGRWISGIRYLWAGPNILLQAHVGTAEPALDLKNSQRFIELKITLRY